jgi:hypothetical protein
VKFSFRLGKRFGWNRLSPEQQDVVERLERGEISEQEAERLLGADVRVVDVRRGDSPAAAADGTAEPVDASSPPPKSDEDTKARELVERIAREVDEELRR